MASGGKEFPKMQDSKMKQTCQRDSTSNALCHKCLFHIYCAELTKRNGQVPLEFAKPPIQITIFHLF